MSEPKRPYLLLASGMYVTADSTGRLGIFLPTGVQVAAIDPVTGQAIFRHNWKRTLFTGSNNQNIGTQNFKSGGLGVTITPLLTGNFWLESDILIFSDNANQYLSAQFYQIASTTIPALGTDVTTTTPPSAPSGDSPQWYIECVVPSNGLSLHMTSYAAGFTIGTPLSFYIATQNQTAPNNNVVFAQATTMTVTEV